jgi:hypothetical protein
MEPARLPETLLKPKPRVLKDLRPGEQISIGFPALKVDPELRCYLNPDAEEVKILPARIRVRRDAEGKYHVDIPADTRYDAEEPMINKAKLLPVASVTVVKSLE